MAIRKIRVTNFKSFRDLEVELRMFNVLIGANASGKSNFIRIFEFLRDRVNHGLDNAVSMQGGIEYLRNINIGPSENLLLEIVSDQQYRRTVRPKEKELIRMKVYETIYKFAIKFRKSRLGFEIAEDSVTHKCKVVRLERHKKEMEEKEELGEGEIIVSKVKGKIKVNLSPELGEVGVREEDIFPPFLFLRGEKALPRTLVIETAFSFMFMPPFEKVFSNISIYDFDPKLPKKATPITGKVELEENGENLAIVLKNILENKEKERRFSNLVRDLLPFVNKLGVEKFADKSLLFNVEEIYAQQYLPASLISDGTIDLSALIVVLYFEEKLLTIIEEPERNIHPTLISRVVGMMKEASQNKQIIVTTHNPELVRHTDPDYLESILLISRDKEGFSNVSRPSETEEVKTFLKNEIGIEELYVQNLLRV